MAIATRTAPKVGHAERHFKGSAVVRDLVIGMADGLTVPFALAAGLASADQSNGVVVTAGVAEIAAGAIAMGLGGYLAGRGDVEHYARERHREEREIVELPIEEEGEIAAIFAEYGITPEESAVIVTGLKRRPEKWRDFMMKFELGLDEPDPARAWRSAATIGGAYIVGGLVPLVPYMVWPGATQALTASIAVTLLALLVFGYVKGKHAGTGGPASAIRTALIGGLAATAAFCVARLVT